MDKEKKGRKPVEGSHRQVVGTTVMQSKLLLEVVEREEGTERIKAFLVLPVAALNLSVMPGCVRTDQFVLNTELSSSFLKKGWKVAFTVRKTVSKFKAIVSLDTFDLDAFSGIPLYQAP